jgi:hypothetical protein
VDDMQCSRYAKKGYEEKRIFCVEDTMSRNKTCRVADTENRRSAENAVQR